MSLGRVWKGGREKQRQNTSDEQLSEKSRGWRRSLIIDVLLCTPHDDMNLSERRVGQQRDVTDSHDETKEEDIAMTPG